MLFATGFVRRLVELNARKTLSSRYKANISESNIFSWQLGLWCFARLSSRRSTGLRDKWEVPICIPIALRANKPRIWWDWMTNSGRLGMLICWNRFCALGWSWKCHDKHFYRCMRSISRSLICLCMPIMVRVTVMVELNRFCTRPCWKTRAIGIAVAHTSRSPSFLEVTCDILKVWTGANSRGWSICWIRCIFGCESYFDEHNVAMTSRYDRGPLGSIQKEASETISLLRETKKRWEELSQRGTQVGNELVQITGHLQCAT